jgi:hypothetical protein
VKDQKNEGEGNRTAARRYNEGVKRTTKKGPPPSAAPSSEEERRELEEAERAGRERAKETDPAVQRDYSTPGGKPAAR